MKACWESRLNQDRDDLFSRQDQVKMWGTEGAGSRDSEMGFKGIDEVLFKLLGKG